jgi:hypothetical protein
VTISSFSDSSAFLASSETDTSSSFGVWSETITGLSEVLGGTIGDGTAAEVVSLVLLVVIVLSLVVPVNAFVSDPCKDNGCCPRDFSFGCCLSVVVVVTPVVVDFVCPENLCLRRDLLLLLMVIATKSVAKGMAARDDATITAVLFDTIFLSLVSL